MKKLVLMLAVACGATMVSCGGSKATNEAAEAAETAEAVDTVEAVVENDTLVAVDSNAVDTVVAETVAVVAE